MALENKILSAPKDIQIEPTVRCNLNCITCDEKARNRAPDMSLEIFTRIIEQLKDVETLRLHGVGESLLNKDFLRMVGLACERGFDVKFNTNVSLLKKSVARYLIDVGLSEIRFSIDAADSLTYQKIRRADLFDKVVRNATDFIDARKGRNTPYIKLVVVLQRENLYQLQEIVTLGEKIGVDEVFIQNMQTWTRPEFNKNIAATNSVLDLEKEELEKVFSNIESTSVKIKFPPVEKNRLGCTWPYTSAYISVEGLLCVCCECHDPRILNFGNILEKPFLELWNSTDYNRFRSDFEQKKAAICRNCIIGMGLFKTY